MACGDCVTHEELPDIIRESVRQALEEYQHECVMHLRPEDAEQMRDLVGAIKEVGDGNLSKGITVIRENHKFVKACHCAAAKIGWGVIIISLSIMGAFGMFAVSFWKHSNGGQ